MTEGVLAGLFTTYTNFLPTFLKRFSVKIPQDSSVAIASFGCAQDRLFRMTGRENRLK